MRGFGFVSTGQPGEPDIYIPAGDANGALHGDTVECIRTQSGSRPEGAVTRIVQRGASLLAGTFRAETRTITALEPKITTAFPVSARVVQSRGLVDGHRVMFRVDPSVRIVEIFGHQNDPGMDVLALVRQFGVPHEFSEATLAEAAALPDCVADFADRADFRSWPIITIDGADTKDIDDALSLRPLPDGHVELGVHIADVSHYVPARSALDTEARARGTSIYLADRVVPMLPHKLSNGICSLHPGVDRLALSCLMAIDPAGNVVAHRVEPSVMHSQRRFTYDEVDAVLAGKAAKGPQFFTQYLWDMHGLAELLRQKRHAGGALDFELAETAIRVDESGFPTAITARKRTAATGLIEEFMILANRVVAERFQGKPFVYRTHERPDLEKMQHLSAFAHSLGYRLPVSERGVSAKALQQLLETVRGTAEETVLGMTMLRSMKQARYTEENSGHFGLGLRTYCHFTSPIRRYPDLLVHRAVKQGLRGRGLPALCVHCSQAERTAEGLEREVTQLKKVQFMRDKVGQAFQAVVSSAMPFGVFVQLPNTVEGLVPVDALTDDDYAYVEKQMAFFGVRKKRRIRPGDALAVVLTRVNEAERKLTFALAEK